jgi:hypothetical protein
MGHRKPLGTTCSMTLNERDWAKPLPELGEYLVSEAGTAYLVVGVEDGRVRRRLILERVAAAPVDAVVHRFFWLPRDTS